MLKKALRLAALVTTACGAVLFSGVQPITTAAATPGSLFAIASSSQFGPTQNILVRIDPVTGAETPLGDFAGASGQGQVTSLTGDPATHRLFGLRFTTIFIPPGSINVTVEILTIDSRSGALIATTPINQDMFQIEFDSSSGSLLGLTPNAIVKIDPMTGAISPLASLSIPCCGILGMALVPGAHTVYVGDTSFGFPGASPTYQILTVDTTTGSVTSTPSLPGRLGFLTYDSSAKVLMTNDIFSLFSIDPLTGVETTIATFNNDSSQTFTFAGAVDPSTDTAFVHIQPVVNTFPPTPLDQVFSINDQTGAFTSSPVISDQLFSLYFEAPPLITAESIKNDVASALASGAIDNPGVATALVSQLDAAEAARTRGDCATAAHIYQAFINAVTAQRGHHVADATASQLISEAQFLIANCP